MGTDRSEVYRGPCKCGGGAIEIDWCSPDHGWSARTWHEKRITCGDCERAYVIVEKGDGFYLVTAEFITAEQAASADWRRRRAQFLDSPRARAIVEDAEQRLEVFPSKAAAHRAIKGILVSDSVGTFRGNVNAAGGYGGWLRNNLSPFSLRVIAEWVGRHDAELDAEIAALDPALWPRPPFEGELLCSTR